MPSDLYNLNSAYGYIDDLKHCIEEMHNQNLLVYVFYISGYKNQFQNFIKYLCEIGDEMDLLNEAEMALSQTNDPTPEVPNGIAGHYLLGLTYRCFPTSCSSN
nr:CDC27 family protein [Ipomoea batatas]